MYRLSMFGVDGGTTANVGSQNAYLVSVDCGDLLVLVDEPLSKVLRSRIFKATSICVLARVMTEVSRGTYYLYLPTSM